MGFLLDAIPISSIHFAFREFLDLEQGFRSWNSGALTPLHGAVEWKVPKPRKASGADSVFDQIAFQSHNYEVAQKRLDCNRFWAI